jgi:DNA-binding XRE family transcriptional regulator
VVSKKTETQRTFWARVKEALRDRGLPATQTYAAGIAGVSQPSISDWNKQGNAAELANALKLAKRLGVCVEWLYTERGPKRPGRPDDALAQRLWDLWPRLPEDVKAEIIGHAAFKARPPKPDDDELPQNRAG